MTSAGNHEIRTAEAGDAALIADLVRRAFAAQSRQTDPPPSALKVTGAAIAAHLARGGGAITERGGRVVGAVLWEEDDRALYISRLSVDPGHRRQGIARALIAAAEREARRRQLPRLTLGVRLALEDNRRLFKSCGFEERTLHCHDGFSEPTWVSMERRLE